MLVSIANREDPDQKLKVQSENYIKTHEYLHTMIKASAKFLNNQFKTKGGVVHIRHPLSIYFDCMQS